MTHWLCWLCILLAPLTTAFAQKDSKRESTTRSVSGVVTDAANNLVEGAVVKLKDTKTLQIRSFITRQDGAYHFHGLNPDVDYELRAETQDAVSSPKTVSSFDSRKNIVINLKVEQKK